MNYQIKPPRALKIQYIKLAKKKTWIFDILCNYNVTRIRPSARGIRPFCRTWCQSGIYVDIAAKPQTVRRRSCGCTTAPPRSPTLSSSRRRHANALGSWNSCRGKRAWEFKPNGSKATTSVSNSSQLTRSIFQHDSEICTDLSRMRRQPKNFQSNKFQGSQPIAVNRFHLAMGWHDS